MNTKRRKLIGEALRKERRAQEKTLLQVAEAIGLAENTISAYEKGKIAIPLDNIDAYCRFLGLDYLEFLKQIQDKMMLS